MFTHIDNVPFREHRDAAVAALNKALDDHRDQLHPEDFRDQPGALRDFIETCNTCDEESLQIRVDVITAWLEQASRRADERSTVYMAVRSPYLAYAAAVLERRFPRPVTQEA